MSKLARYLRSHGLSGESEVHPKENRITNLAWGLVSAGAGAAALGLCITFFDTKATLLEKLSSYGSYLQGAVGSLWALAGLLFIYVTFLAQKRQLQQQTDELEEQQEQFEIQRRDSQLQQESIKQQNFENTFFHLLNLHNQLVTDMAIETDGGDGPVRQLRGRECFLQLYAEFRNNDWGVQFKTDPDQLVVVESPTPQVRYSTYYQKNRYHQYLGHYFRTLYHLIKFVKDSGVRNKRRYTSLVRAQLSAFELALLFYNCASSHGEKFKPLVEEFGLLEHLDQSLLFKPADTKLYAESAYR